MLKLSEYPFHTLRNTSGEDGESNNILVRAGYIRQELAGAYNYLPLGFKVIEKIKKTIREHLEKIGSLEIQMTALGSRDHWEKTGRDQMEILFKVPFSDGKYNFLNPTHEEIVTPLIKEFIKSYKDLPLSVFQIQSKFRNEKRAKSGILRGREFLMKDMYSFHTSLEDLEKYYQKAIQAYHDIFKDLGIGNDTYLTYASGGTFSKYSHEFQTLTPIGEDTIHVDKEKKIALNKEIINDSDVKSEFSNYSFIEENASEIGNIFQLGTKFSDPFEMKFIDNNGVSQQIYMGCYGIGVSRCMGIVAEKLQDEKGLVRPKNIAPYDVYVIAIGDEKINQEAEKLISILENKGLSVIYDDRSISPGIKFKDSDLLGIPSKIIVSEKSIAAGGYEYEERSTGDKKIITDENFDILLKTI
ncbi:MAG: His/Gly/Thr/Pro-type tRNA ligase C-terminal domain-containing protein [Candidatus Absconditabacteria bacterium]|nr:His/Gly/Thr/Pro-type tRNA ligase C-terminal domain-containing protein [Candidatus Absconditabacteria bacterium]